MKKSYKRREQLCKLRGPVVPGEDNAIHRINHYPVDCKVCFVSTYSLDSDLSGVKVLAPSFSVASYNTPFILPSHLLRNSSYMNFFRIQCNIILYKYTHTYFFHFPFILLIFFRVPGCSGMFHVPGFIDGIITWSRNRLCLIH